MRPSNRNPRARSIGRAPARRADRDPPSWLLRGGELRLRRFKSRAADHDLPHGPTPWLSGARRTRRVGPAIQGAIARSGKMSTDPRQPLVQFAPPFADQWLSVRKRPLLQARAGGRGFILARYHLYWQVYFHNGSACKLAGSRRRVFFCSQAAHGNLGIGSGILKGDGR
jgi:hypothetical protein